MATGGVFKVRRKLLAKGGQQVGSSGTNITKILAGTVSACVPVISASATGSGSMAITNAEAGDIVVLSGSDVNSGVMAYAAVATAANSVTASYMNPTGADTSASTLTFNYVIYKTG